MPSLDAVSISKPFYKSWTSQAEVNHHLIWLLISLFSLQSQYHSLTLPRKPRKSPQSNIWRQHAFLDPSSSPDVNQNHSNRVRLLVQSFESQVFCKVRLYLKQILRCYHPPVWYGVMRACNVGFSSNFMTSYLHTFLAPLLQNPVSCDCQKYLT